MHQYNIQLQPHRTTAVKHNIKNYGNEQIYIMKKCPPSISK